jgi:hypothetical protein
MRKTMLLILTGAFMMTVPAETYAATCYTKVKTLCVKSAFGRLNSTCTSSCAVGWKRSNGQVKLACLS